MAAPLKNVYYDMMKKKLYPERGYVYYKEKAFLLCKSCFWCASILCDDESRPFRTCPNCMDYELDLCQYQLMRHTNSIMTEDMAFQWNLFKELELVEDLRDVPLRI